jgi:putative ABC transport system substrate-binding protein
VNPNSGYPLSERIGRYSSGRRRFLAASAALLVAPALGVAQRRIRIGVVISGELRAFEARVQALREGMRELGYVEGRNVEYEVRAAGGEMDRIPSLAADLERLKVDVIVTHGGLAIQKVKQATTTTPIVMGNASDPVALGLVSSLARPGGLVTGLSIIFKDVTAKGLEVLHETLPAVKRMVILYAPDSYIADAMKETGARAQALGIELHVVKVSRPDGIASAFPEIRNAKPGALMIFDHNWFVSRQRELASLSLGEGLPTMFSQPEFIDTGGFMSYGARLSDMWRRAAMYVDKIVTGTKPGELPIEQPLKFDLVLNLQTAKRLGVTVPQSILLRADRVIG